MKKSILLLLISLFLSCSSSKEEIPYDLIITNVNLIDGTGSPMQSNVNVYVTDRQIAKIDSEDINQDQNVIDGTGKYIIPGLFDCHVHTENYEYDFPRFMHYGVTSIFITGGSLCTNQYYAEMRARGNQDSIPAPRVFHTSQHFTMEGRHPVKTYISPLWRNGESVFFLTDTIQIEKLVKEVVKYPIQGIKLTIEEGPSPPWVERMPQVFVDKVQKEAARNGTEVFAHVSDNIELKMALDAGIQNFVHWTGVDIDFGKDSVLLEKIYEIKPDWITTLMIDKGFIYPLYPEWIEKIRKENVYSEERLNLAYDSGYIARAQQYFDFTKEYMQLEKMTLKDIAEFQVSDIQKLQDNGINFTLGTDISTFVLPGYGLHEEMELFQLGGMDPLTIIKMGTLNAATMMRAQDSLGSIEPGKLADMILLEKNPLEDISNTLAIETVIKSGAIQKRITN